MKKWTLAISACCAILGSAAILLSGLKTEKGIEGWEPLNNNLASALDGERMPESKSGGGQDPSGAAKTGKENIGAENAASAAKTRQPKQSVQTELQTGQETASAPEPQADSNAATKTGTGSPAGEAAPPGSGSSPVHAAPDKAAGDLETKSPEGPSGPKVNINTAQAAELMTIPGIGAKKAQAIIDYRNERGPFKRVADLDKVKGIGPKMLEKIKPYIEL